MAFASGEVVSTPGKEMPFKVVFKQGDTILNEWPVSSIAEGQAQIIEILQGLRKLSKDEGHL